MALVSMAVEDKSTEAMPDNPYGYGLCIRLNDDQCEALGITSIIPAGTRVMISASAIVKSATESVEDDQDDTGTDVYLELQITDMELNSSQRPEAEAARVLYSAAKPNTQPSPVAQVVNPMTMTKLG